MAGGSARHASFSGAEEPADRPVSRGGGVAGPSGTAPTTVAVPAGASISYEPVERLPAALTAPKPPVGSKRRLERAAASGSSDHKRHGKGKGPAVRKEMAVIDVSDADEPAAARANSLVVIPDDSDVEVVDPSDDNISGAASRRVPTAQLRGIVTSSKRVEKGVLQVAKLAE